MKSVAQQQGMSSHGDTTGVVLAAGTAFLSTLILYTSTAAHTITTQFGGVDGGELAATAVSGGVPHPPGYPTYMLLARAALLHPFDEPAGRLALLSAWSGTLAVACTTALVTWRLSKTTAGRPSLLSLAAGLYAGLCLALSPRAWSQAIIPEVYALHLFWLALCALLGLGWLATGRQRVLVGAVLCLGLGLGTHLTLLAYAPALALAWTVALWRPRLPLRLAGLAAGALVAGLSVYGLLPLWAAREATPSWGDLRNLTGFWAHVSGAEYQYLVGVVPWPERLSRLVFSVHDLLTQLGPVGLGLGLWGLFQAWATDRPVVALLGVVALLSLVFAISYGGADGTVYLLPWTWAWCVWAGVGAHTIGTELAETVGRRRLVLSGLLAVLAGSLLWSMWTQYDQLDLSDDTTARDQAVAQLAALPAEAILLTSDDAATFGAWYAQHALKIREDVLVVDTRLLAQPWYRAQLRRQLNIETGQSVCQVIRESPRPRYEITDSGEREPLQTMVWPEESLCAD